jgi:cytochrome c oxidase subunit 3
MHALPPAPQPAPRRQLFVGTGLASAAGVMLIGGMLAVWSQFRADAPTRFSERRGAIKDWMPADIVVPEVAANMMLIAFGVVCVMAQWAVYSAKRDDRQHAGMALGMTLLMGLAALNAQIFIWTQMGVGIRDGAFHSMFYALTGTMAFLVIAGLVYTAVATFRYLGRGNSDVSIVSASALYWYFITAAFTAVWFVVYVQK